MLSLSYLQNILADIMPPTNIIESDAGYDAIIELIQTKGLEKVIIFEPPEGGVFKLLPWGMDEAACSIWVMRMVGNEENRREIQKQCRKTLKAIIATFSVHRRDAALQGFQIESIPYSVRNAGANYTGYEMTIYFNDDTNLSPQ